MAIDPTAGVNVEIIDDDDEGPRVDPETGTIEVDQEDGGVVVHQDGLEVARRSLPWPASPGRVLRVPWSVLDSVVIGRGPVTVSLR